VAFELPKRIADNIGHFTGRAWLLPKVLEWWDNRSDERLFLLTGGPGTGKSVIVARFAGLEPEPSDPLVASEDLKRLKREVKAGYFCQAASRNISPQAFAKSIANQLMGTALALASGTGIFLLIGDKPIEPRLLLAIGAFGFVVTLGLFVFEIYGIRRCTHLIVFGEWLEGQLRSEGQLKHRPRGLEGCGLIPKNLAPFISEPLASGNIYPAVMGAWAFLALFKDKTSVTLAGLFAVTVFVVGFCISQAFNRWLGNTDVKNKRINLGLPVNGVCNEPLEE
jgi:hypothetical protein